MLELATCQLAGQRDIADLEVRLVRVSRNDKRRMLGSQEIGAAGAGHAWQREVIRQPVVATQLVAGHGTHAWVKADESSTAHRDPGRRPGHHVMVPGTVVSLVVANGPDQGPAIERGGQLGHVLGEADSRNTGGDRVEFTPNFSRGIRLGVKCFEVSRAAVHPDQDAAGGRGRTGCSVPGGQSLAPQCIDQPSSEQASQSELQAVSPREPLAITRITHVKFSALWTMLMVNFNLPNR